MFRSLLRGSAFLLTISAALLATPQLRLSTTSIGPISIAVGAAGAGQTIEAWNAGDGSLKLQVSSTVTWISTGTGAQRNCTTRTGTCIPISIGLLTTSLLKGTYTAVVKVADPNAVDAPQSITVTVAIGGGVPDKVDLYVSPNGTATTTFSTNTAMTGSIPVATQSGGNWLAVALIGNGSFQFVQTYRVTGTWQAGMTDGGTYTGSFTTSGSTIAAENKTVPVTLHSTTGAIADPSPASLRFRVAQGAGKQTQYMSVANRGVAALTTGTPAASGGTWLSAEYLASYNLIGVTVDVTGMNPGISTGSVTVNSNAANGALTIPVNLEVVQSTGPLSYFGGVLTNNSAVPNVAPGTIASVYGEQFTYKDPASITKLPLEKQLNEVKVYLNDSPVPIFYISYGQVNFLVPFETRQGNATVRVERDGLSGNYVSLAVNLREPRILPLAGTYGILVNQDGSFPLPASYGAGYHPAKVGDTLVIYALGLGPTAPSVASGVGSPAAEPFARVSVPTKVVLSLGLSKTSVDAAFAGLTPNFVGLYQVNFVVPADAPRNDAVNVAIQLGGDIISPSATMAIQ